MSLILDALNRAERERHKAPVPDLQTRHEPAATLAAPSPISYRLVPGLIVLGLVLALTAYLLVAPQPPESAAVGAPARELDPVDSSPAAPVQQSPAPANASLVDKEVLSSADADHGAAEIAVASPLNETADSSVPAEETTTDLDALYASARALEKQSLAPEPVESLYREPVVAAPPPEVMTVPATELEARSYERLIDIPDIGDLPSGLRQQIPSINYVRHNFDPRGARSVVINGVAHREGASLEQDLMLEEIYSDGVICRFKQIRFKLRALNSWINM